MIDPTDAANFALQAIVMSAFPLGVAVCLRRCERRASAALIGLLACGVIPFFTAAGPVKESVIRIEPLPAVETFVPSDPVEILPVVTDPPGTNAKPAIHRDAVSWIIPVWSGGSLLGLVFMLRELVKTRRWQRTLVPPDESESGKILGHLSAGFGADRFRISMDASGPCVTGFFKPRIVLPKWLLETGDDRELAWALRHESEHLRCHDSRWIHVIRLLRIVQWWNPLLPLLAGIWANSREQACDLRAAGHPGERPDYGHFLLKVAGRKFSRLTATMAVSGESKRLRRRIAGLLKSKSATAAAAGRGWTLAMGGATLLAGVFMSALGFSQPALTKPPGGAGDDLSWLEPVPAVRFQTVVVISPVPIAAAEEILTNEELLKRFARFSGMKGFHLQHLNYSSSVQSGSVATLQLTANRTSSITSPPWDGDKTLDPFVGWVIHYQPQVSGDAVKLGIRAAYAFPPGNHPAPGLYLRRDFRRPFGTFSGNSDEPLVLPEGKSWMELGMKTASASATLHAGEILCTSLGEVEAGVHAAVLTGLSLRMPWDHTAPLLLTSLSSASSPKDTPIAVVMHAVDGKDLSPEERVHWEQMQILTGKLREKVDSHFENRDLRKMRDGLQAELDEAVRTGNPDQMAPIQWRIGKITRRMEENCEGDFEMLRREIKELSDNHSKKRTEKLAESMRTDAKRFNKQEQ